MSAKKFPFSPGGILALTTVIGLSAGLGWWLMGNHHPAPHPHSETTAALVPLSVSTPAAPIRPEVTNALGGGTDVAPIERLDLLRAMGSDLNPDERDALLAALSERRPPNVPSGWHSEYVHEISNVLQRQPQGQEKFARVLAGVAADATREEVVRDYAIQHLRILWQSGEQVEGLRKGIEGTFRQIAGNDAVLSASALLSLHLLGTLGLAPVSEGPSAVAPPSSGEFVLPNQDLEPVVAEILRQPPTSTNIKARMTALRVVRERALGAQTGAVKAICGNLTEHALVRMTAIPTLAALEGKNAIADLESLDQSDPRIESAVRHTMAKIR